MSLSQLYIDSRIINGWYFIRSLAFKLLAGREIFFLMIYLEVSIYKEDTYDQIYKKYNMLILLCELKGDGGKTIVMQPAVDFASSFTSEKCFS